MKQATTNKDHVKAFLGLVGFYKKLIPSSTELKDALQKIFSKEASFLWGDEHEKAFIKITKLADRRKFSYPS
jgi:hypothetical protein